MVEIAQVGRVGLPHRARAQRGSIAIMFAGLLLVMLGFCGLALDVSRVYNRIVELQTVADGAALAAARELNGTADGVSKAEAAAAQTLQGDSGLKYKYTLPMTWNDAAIRFGSSSDRGGSWADVGAASASPAGLLYVKVDTGELGAAYGTVETLFMRLLSSEYTSVNIKGSAVAGRSSINLTPLGICAMSLNATASRANAAGYAELVEYGFRRGVNYDLMQLNPNGVTAENFVVNPVAPPGTAGKPADLAAASVGPYVCSGTMAMPRVKGASVSVGRPFPIGQLYVQLNSRFDSYVGEMCKPNAAPPDSNVRPYVYNSNISWMGAAPSSQSAQLSGETTVLRTVADPDVVAGATTAKMYGPLWAYAKAVPYASLSAGPPEPPGGYATFAASTTVWGKLYPPGPAPASYPLNGKTPYSANVNWLGPDPSHGLGVPNRRVLNIPLLQCPVTAGASASATVLAIGKFFMTTPATSTSINAEFAGATSDEYVKGPVELYP